MEVNDYRIGKLITLNGLFKDANGVLQNPTDAYVGVLDPKGVQQVYKFGVDVEVTQVGTGTFRITIEPLVPGLWNYRWFSTGTGQTADEGVFRVIATKFQPIP